MKTYSIDIQRYTAAQGGMWDAFVERSKNGTFLFKRAYMDYHADRFEDYSLLIFNELRLVAMLPANKNGNMLYSHQGLTYGSLIVTSEISQTLMLHIFNALRAYLKSQNFEKLYYKTIPAIYHKQPCEEDLYALYRAEAQLVTRNCSTTILLQKPNSSSRLKRAKKRAEKYHLRYEEHANVDAFWHIIEEIRLRKHNILPAHNQLEINKLQALFPQNIRSFAVYSDDQIVAGAVVYLANEVVHLQYASSSPEGEKMHAADYLYALIINELFPTYRYFDFGISTENAGKYLNETLIAHKEEFGGGTVVYDHYLIDTR